MVMDSVNIIVAYNNDSITELLRTIIETKYNANIDIVKHASQVYELVQANDYDIMMIDEYFSKNPFTVIEELRKSETTKKLPISIFTSTLTEETYKKAFDLGVIDFLSKPFSLDHIYLIIDFVLHKKGGGKSFGNRRNTVRCDKKLYIKYSKARAEDVQALKDVIHIVTTEDVSSTGVRICADSGVLKDDELDLEIMLGNPYDNDNIKTSGKVVWTKQNNPDHVTAGIEFLSLNATDRLKINNSIYSH